MAVFNRTKIYLIAFQFLMIVTSGFAQPLLEKNVVDKEGKKQGLWIKLYENKEDTLYKGQFKNDQPYGSFKYFYEGGKTKAIVKHSSSGKVSNSISYYPDGATIMAEGKYVNQLKDSTWNFYDNAGKLKTREIYSLGKLNGTSIIYYQDGSISEKSNFENGVKNGEWLQFYSNGNKRLTATIKQDISYDGEYTQYFENGKPKISGKYEDGLREGTWFTYLESGALEAQYLYKLGKITKDKKENGTFKEYYPDDIPKSEINYKNGKKSGSFKEFYMLGEWKTKYSTDAEDGTKQEFLALEGIQIKTEGNYLNDLLEGEIIYYLENGSIEKKEKYSKGNLIK